MLVASYEGTNSTAQRIGYRLLWPSLKEQYDIVLRSVTEPIDTASPMGGMIFAILASFAAEEGRVITSRTVAGKKEKASRGGFAGGAAPLGYKRDLQGGLLVTFRRKMMFS